MRLSKIIAVAGVVSALAVPLAAQADVMTGPGSTGASTSSGTTTGSSSSGNASSGSGATSSTGSGGGGSDSSSGGCSVQPGQTAGAIGLAAIPALALVLLRLRRKKD